MCGTEKLSRVDQIRPGRKVCRAARSVAEAEHVLLEVVGQVIEDLVLGGVSPS